MPGVKTRLLPGILSQSRALRPEHPFGFLPFNLFNFTLYPFNL